MNIKNILGIGFFLSLSIFSLYSMHESLQEKRDRLMYSIWTDDFYTIQMLLNEGLSPNFSWGCYNITPLQEAIYRGDYDIVEALLDHGANQNFERPFYEAALRNNIPIMKLLIQRGANWKIHYDAIVNPPPGTGKDITEPTKRWLKEYATLQPKGAE